MFFWEIYKFFRSSHQKYSMNKAFLKKFAIFTGKLQACSLIKKILQNRYFPLNIAKHLFSRTSTNSCLKELQNSDEQLVLYPFFY